MLEPSKNEKEDSDEGRAFQSGEDYRYFERGGVQDKHYRRAVQEAWCFGSDLLPHPQIVCVQCKKVIVDLVTLKDMTSEVLDETR